VIPFATEVCPYANICQQSDNFVPAPECAPALVDQLVEVQALRTGAEQYGCRRSREFPRVDH
jgi:hypothetical protein